MSKLNLWMKAGGVLLLWGTTAIALPAQTFTSLYSFCAQSNCTDGGDPYGGLTQGADGNLYGTTSGGWGALGNGTVFRITPNGTLATLHNFDNTDGQNPVATLVQGTNGDFYGTTEYGGGNCFDGCGTIFDIIPSGTLTTLHSFDNADGASPTAGLVQATNGKFYGITSSGGTYGVGTVFSITAGGTLTTLHTFAVGTEDGEFPEGLVQGADGKFYGTTNGGGASNEGTVFSITATGTFTTLHSFDGTDGSNPLSGLVQGADGNFYGTTAAGGNLTCPGGGCGTIFKITPSGTLTTLYTFDGTDGKTPIAGLVQGTDGNFYGTTIGGGTYLDGTVFSITAEGTLTILHSFGIVDGSAPWGTLLQDTNGAFYGTTVDGGANGDGTAFSLSVGLGPFVKTEPASGKVGVPIRILGSNLTGATMVTFHGTPATFVVKSKSEITTTVPTGATNGLIKVVTPGGTLSSNVPFRVTP